MIHAGIASAKGRSLASLLISTASPFAGQN